ncbi:hypothetical protein CH365_19580 [Leptospira neocaledonica]|uniref:Histidine kinase n=1 Tax=Leptospira neocaledonica TaxID=2023192 RepID=A0A2M9ZTV9_9LEPT|nr:hypothetical protein CH365_19580 [Leptospira neocaledonica]
MLAHTFIIDEVVSLWLYLLFKFLINFWLVSRRLYDFKFENPWTYIFSFLLTLADYLYFPLFQYLQRIQEFDSFYIAIPLLFLIKGVSWSLVAFINTYSSDKLSRYSSWLYAIVLSALADFLIALPVIFIGFLIAAF